jgi:8-amino-7-oxononanoate synthase
MLDAFRSRVDEILAPVRAVREAGTYHYGRTVTSSSDATVTIGGREILNFISNNYLGFSVHPRVIEAARAAALRYGTGMCGSPLACGTTDLHLRLAERVAAWVGMPAAMIFATGYQALLGTVAGMCGPGDLCILDSLAHRSIVDGARMSGARIRTFVHNQVEDLAEILQKTGDVPRRLVAVDSVYSMEGDLAPLAELSRLCREHRAALLIDEAHSLGVMGAHGRGLMEHIGLPGAADLAAGTFSKFGGAIGGWAAGPADAIDALRHSSSPFVFSSSLPPALCAGILAAFDVMEAEPEWHQRLHANVRLLGDGLRAAGFRTNECLTPVVPVFVGDPMKTMHFNHRAFAGGLLASPVMAPVVPPKKSMLRLGVMARHTPAQLERAVEILKVAGREAGVL